jgi:hypothetical protein
LQSEGVSSYIGCGIHDPQECLAPVLAFADLRLGEAKHCFEKIRANEGESNTIVLYRPLFLLEKRVKADRDLDLLWAIDKPI